MPANVPTARQRDDRPEWSKAPFYLFLDYLETETRLVGLAKDGVQSLVHAEGIAKALHGVAEILETPQAEAEERVQRAQERADLARQELDADFPLLHGHSLVGVWVWVPGSPSTPSSTCTTLSTTSGSCPASCSTRARTTTTTRIWGHRLLSHYLGQAGISHEHRENPGNHGGRANESYQTALHRRCCAATSPEQVAARRCLTGSPNQVELCEVRRWVRERRAFAAWHCDLSLQ